MESALAWLQPMLEGALGQYSWLLPVMTVVGALRLFVKPVMSMILAYVQLTPKKTDDAWFNQYVLEAKWYKVVSYILDWFGSIKLPKAEK